MPRRPLEVGRLLLPSVFNPPPRWPRGLPERRVFLANSLKPHAHRDANAGDEASAGVLKLEFAQPSRSSVRTQALPRSSSNRIGSWPGAQPKSDPQCGGTFTPTWTRRRRSRCPTSNWPRPRLRRSSPASARCRADMRQLQDKQMH